MKVSKVIEICLDYHRNHSKPNTVRSYEAILTKFGLIFGDKDLKKFPRRTFSPFSAKSQMAESNKPDELGIHIWRHFSILL